VADNRIITPDGLCRDHDADGVRERCESRLRDGVPRPSCRYSGAIKNGPWNAEKENTITTVDRRNPRLSKRRILKMGCSLRSSVLKKIGTGDAPAAALASTSARWAGTPTPVLLDDREAASAAVRYTG
jgi:hypothetical protein